ncbi:MAG: energy-coupling factor transporter transmembrane protein EcfT [Oscillospiraceae bacterium]|nr:energy-coupling factor transporter transmembrane protein EcfT [Oscillospiraceae bacterium]
MPRKKQSPKISSTHTLPDPRVVFVFALYFSTFAVIFRTPLPMTILLIIAVDYSIAIRVPFKKLWGRLKRLWQIVLAVSILQSVFVQSGETLIGIGGLPIVTLGGLLTGLTVLLRLALLITSASMLSVYPPRTLIQGMLQLGVPQEIAYMVSIGLRFIPQMGQALRDSIIALQLRGIEPRELKLIGRIRLYSYLLMPAVASTLQNARELSMSLEMRGFRAYNKRSSYRRLSLKTGDIFLLGAIGLFTIFTAIFAINPSIIPFVELEFWGWIFRKGD